MARPSKFNEQISDKILELIKKGKNYEQIAEIVNINPRTIYNWMDSRPEFYQALKETKQAANQLVEASLFHRATGYTHEEEKIFCDKGSIVTHKTLKHYPPDPTSAIFWLKNKDPENWRDKTEVEQKTTHKVEEIDELKTLLTKLISE